MHRKYSIDPGFALAEVAVIRDELSMAGWQETEGDDWDLFWGGDLPTLETYASLGDHQWINHLPGVSAFGLKSDLHDNVWAAREWVSGGDLYQFHPRSFSMPDDYVDWRRVADAEPTSLWLQKPKGLSRGRGIELVLDVDRAPKTHEWLIQEYVARPHLLDGHKYVLRLYLLVTSLHPLICYVHENGTCKVASRSYNLDSDSLSDRFIHLTNPPVQKGNSEVPFGSQNTDLKTYRARIRREGIDDETLFDRIEDAVTQLVIACREQALLECREIEGNLHGCFEFLGLDVLIDEDLKPWILECNLGPKMAVSDQYDLEAAKMIRLAKNAASADMLSLLGFTRSTGQGPVHKAEDYWEKRLAFELKGARGFRRLWPRPNPERWLPCFPLPRPSDLRLLEFVSGTPEVHSTISPLEVSASVFAHPLKDGLALFAEHQHRIYWLNDSAGVVWLSLSEGLSPDEITAELCAARSELDPAVVLEETWDLLVAWAQRGLLLGYDHPRRSEISVVLAEPQEVPGWIDGRALFLAESTEDVGRAGVVLLPEQVDRVVLLGTRVEASIVASSTPALVDRILHLTASTDWLDNSVVGELLAWADGMSVFDFAQGRDGDPQGSRLKSLLTE